MPRSQWTYCATLDSVVRDVVIISVHVKLNMTNWIINRVSSAAAAADAAGAGAAAAAGAADAAAGAAAAAAVVVAAARENFINLSNKEESKLF